MYLVDQKADEGLFSLVLNTLGSLKKQDLTHYLKSYNTVQNETFGA